MADPIETWRVQQFSNLVRQGLQERGGKLRSCVDFNGGYVGKAVSPVNYLGDTTAQRVVDRRGDTPHMDVPTGRRWVTPSDWEWGHLVDNVDTLRTGIAPEGPMMTAGQNAMRRAEDVEVLGSFFGTAKTGEAGGDSEVWSDTGFSVAVGSTGLTHAKLKEANKIFGAKKVELEMEDKYLIVTEEEIYDLFGDTTSISLDFIEGRPVMTGKLPQLYGFNFVPFSSAVIDAIPGLKSGATRSLPCWVRTGVHLGVWQDMMADVFPRPDKKNMPQVYIRQTMGATRLEPGRVLRVYTTH